MDSPPIRTYRVVLTSSAKRQLSELARKLGRPGFQQVRSAILELRLEPEKRTQPLTGRLAAFRSLHIGRVRVIIRIEDAAVTVYVVAAGWHTSGDRDDIYRALERQVRRGEPPDAGPTEEMREDAP